VEVEGSQKTPVPQTGGWEGQTDGMQHPAGGIVANTFWVVNWLYPTWPYQAATADLTLISYGTG
jgi:hypothetical protein